MRSLVRKSNLYVTGIVTVRIMQITKRENTG